MCPFRPGDLKHSCLRIVGTSQASANYWFPDSSWLLEQFSLGSVQKTKALGELLAPRKNIHWFGACGELTQL